MNLDENKVFVDFLRDKLSMVEKFVIIGDLNYPGIDWFSYLSNSRNLVGEENEFLSFVNENNLVQKVHQPTRELNILDLCLTTNEEIISELEVCETFSTSDHNYFHFKIVINCNDIS